MSEELKLIKQGTCLLLELCLVRELIVIILGFCLLFAYFITSPDQVFEDCLGPDVPAHCVD